MTRHDRDVTVRADPAPTANEDALRIVRRVGLGLLVASLFVDSAAQHLFRWRSRFSAFQYRIVPDIGGPGTVLADIAIEILDASSPR